MKKIRNKGLRIAGIVMSMIGLALLARPLIGAALGQPLAFTFFGLFGGGAAVAVSAVFLVAGLAVVACTEPWEDEDRGR